MEVTKTKVITGVDVRGLTTFVGLASLAAAIPFMVHIQWLSGPMVNAILILILFLSGIRSAMVAALVPSLMALAGGLLPSPLAPAVPFIMISNVIYILVIDFIYNRSKDENKGYWLGVATASLAKFIFLYFSVSYIVEILSKKDLAVKVAQMMSWPQLATAITGGLIAWAFLKWLKRI